MTAKHVPSRTPAPKADICKHFKAMQITINLDYSLLIIILYIKLLINIIIINS